MLQPDWSEFITMVQVRIMITLMDTTIFYIDLKHDDSDNQKSDPMSLEPSYPSASSSSHIMDTGSASCDPSDI